MTRINRRDFLKLSASALGGAALASVLRPFDGARGGGTRPNIVVLVLDSMSAPNLSLHGYVRPTTPNLARIAERAVVYHSHYSAGNFTTSGVASMLTGLYPWAHRAIGFRGLVERGLADQNIFGLLGDSYYCFGHTQNSLCGLLLSQFADDLDERVNASSFAYLQNVKAIEEDLPRDQLMATYGFREFLGAHQAKPASLLLGYYNLASMVATQTGKTPSYPLGPPTTLYTNFNLEDVFAGVMEALLELAKTHAPFFAYSHLYPPHSPYRPRRDFLKLFWGDGVKFPSKPNHPLSESRQSAENLDILRRDYDAYLADVDQEVGLFVRGLNQAGLLDSTYLIITSDHGELFERSEVGHGSPLMYEAVLKIPLLVLPPGKTERRDVYSPTSNVDLLPTLLSIAGREIPSHIEGRLLPGLGGKEDADRSVYSVFAKENSSFLPLTKAVASIVKGTDKLIYYRGYPGYDEKFELYRLAEDPDELRDLAADDPVTAKRLRDELLDTWNTAEHSYQNRRGIKP